MLDEKGNPAAGVLLVAWFVDGQGKANWYGACAWSGKDGGFAFRGLEDRAGLSLAAFPGARFAQEMDFADPEAPTVSDDFLGDPKTHRFPPSAGFKNIPPGTPSLDIRLGSGILPLR